MYRVDLVRVDTTGHDMCVAGTNILEKEKKNARAASILTRLLPVATYLSLRLLRELVDYARAASTPTRLLPVASTCLSLRLLRDGQQPVRSASLM